MIFIIMQYLSPIEAFISLLIIWYSAVCTSASSIIKYLDCHCMIGIYYNL